MIKIDKNEVECHGPLKVLVAEASGAVYTVAKLMSDSCNIPYVEAFQKIIGDCYNVGIQTYKQDFKDK